MTDTERIQRLEGQLAQLAKARLTTEPSPEILADSLRFSPLTKTILKWSAVSLASVFLAGGAYAKFQHDIALKTDIEAHINNDFEPLKSEVTNVGKGVKVLLQERARNLEIARLQRKIEMHRRSYDEDMADYRANNARGRHPRKPKRNESWINLEAELESVLQREIPLPVGWGSP